MLFICFCSFYISCVCLSLTFQFISTKSNMRDVNHDSYCSNDQNFHLKLYEKNRIGPESRSSLSAVGGAGPESFWHQVFNR